MKDFLRYSKNRFLYSFFKLLILLAIGFVIGSLKVQAKEISPSSWSFLGVSGYSSSGFAAGDKLTGSIAATVPDLEDAYPYVNVYFATNGQVHSQSLYLTYPYPYLNGSFDIKSLGYTIKVDGFDCPVYLLQFSFQKLNATSGWNCSSSGTNCYFSEVINYENWAGHWVVKKVIDFKLSDEKINMDNTTNNKLDEAEVTRKGIWETIKSIPSTIGNFFDSLGTKIGTFFDNLATKIGNFFKDLLDGIIDGLKTLFIPEDGYFETWFNNFKNYFEVKLGFLATPFTIFIDFVNSYLELDSSNDIIIDIPDITVPNFEENKIVSATSFNWSQTLKSKESLNTLWQLYLSFIDVYLILNFINLCENKYNRIFGGDTSNYEYYTVEDSYTFDNDTGEVLSSRRNERTTTRKKVDK